MGFADLSVVQRGLGEAIHPRCDSDSPLKKVGVDLIWRGEIACNSKVTEFSLDQR